MILTYDYSNEFWDQKTITCFFCKQKLKTWSKSPYDAVKKIPLTCCKKKLILQSGLRRYFTEYHISHMHVFRQCRAVCLKGVST